MTIYTIAAGVLLVAITLAHFPLWLHFGLCMLVGAAWEAVRDARKRARR